MKFRGCWAEVRRSFITPVDFELETKCFQFYAIDRDNFNLDSSHQAGRICK